MVSKNLINLESILSLGSKLNESLDIEFIFSSSLLSLMGKLLIKKGCGFVRQADGFEQVVCKGTNEVVDINSMNFAAEQLWNIPPETEVFSRGYRLALFLKSQQKIVGIILLGQRLIDKDLTEEEMQYIKIVGSITSTALSNTLHFNELITERDTIQRQNLLLRTLIDISNDFKNITSREHILKLFSLYLKGNLRINKQAVFLIDGKTITQLLNDFGEIIDENTILSLYNLPSITLIRDWTAQNPPLGIPQSIAIVAPLIYRGDKKGILLIGKRLDNTEFSDDNLSFIELIANALITALENNRLFMEELQKEKLERELDLAKEIQNNLLPKTNPLVQGWDIVGKSIPSKTVGGDYFDIIQIKQNEYLFVIADISGKGVPAAILMSNLQAIIKTLISLNLPLNELIKRVNTILFHNTTFDKFATMFIAKLDLATSELEYINAGHNSPIYLKANGSVIELSEGCLLLGIIEDIGEVVSSKVKLDSHDIILLYTDGINEAININHEEFGSDRIIRIIKQSMNAVSAEILDNIFSNVKEFSAGMEQYDDMTAIIIKKVENVS